MIGLCVISCALLILVFIVAFRCICLADKVDIASTEKESLIQDKKALQEKFDNCEENRKITLNNRVSAEDRLEAIERIRTIPIEDVRRFLDDCRVREPKVQTTITTSSS